MKPRLSSNLIPRLWCVLLLVTGASAQEMATITQVPSLGGSGMTVYGLNNAGQITGFSYTSGNAAAHAFLYGANGIVDLGSLGGTVSIGYAINSLGQVVGDADLEGDLVSDAFLWDGSALQDLGTLGGSYAEAIGINDAGQVCGTSLTESNANEAFLYSDGVVTPLGDLGGGWSQAVAINQRGTVVGYSAAGGGGRSFIYADGAMADMGTLDGGGTYVYGLNNFDMAVGECWTLTKTERAFLYSGGSLTDLGTLGGDNQSIAFAINDAGQVIGISWVAGSPDTHAFIYADGVMADLGTFGGIDTEPYAINSAGQVVGYSLDPEFTSYAFLWQNGSLIDLNTVLPPDSGWQLSDAQFINDSGQIVGQGFFNGVPAWYLLSPGTGNQALVANAGPDQTVECGGEVTLDGSGSSGPDGGTLAYEWRDESGTVLSTAVTFTAPPPLVGIHVFTLKVTDSSGAFAEDTVKVSVVDTTPPVIASVSATPNVLAQPNNQLVAVTVDVVAADGCDGAPVSTIQSVSSNEPLDAGDYQITGPLTVELAASRDPAGTGRIYTINLQCVDASGNSTTASVDVTVPKGHNGSLKPLRSHP